MQKINWLERKDYQGEQYYDVTLEDGRKARLNEKTKKGEVYPDWENLKPGAEIDDAQLWQSEKGYWYIFPPKPIVQNAVRKGLSGVKEAQERKATFIEHAQQSKEEGIKIASTMSGAVSLAVAEGSTNLAEAVKRWRQFLWESWDDHKDYPPFVG